MRCRNLGPGLLAALMLSSSAPSAGWLADFVVLAEDILAVAPERLGEVRVDMTVVGGRVVYGR